MSGDSFDRDDLRSGCAKPTTMGKTPPQGIARPQMSLGSRLKTLTY